MTDKDLESKCKHLSEDVSEIFHILSHDPSLALYRIQEHIRKNLPILVENRIEVSQMHTGLQGACFDLENGIEAVQSMARAGPAFQKIHEMLRGSMYYKQQLDYERVRRQEKESAAAGKFYHVGSTDSLAQELRKTRSMGHIRDNASDVMSDSVMSRSTASTPVSEFPEGLNFGDFGSSTSTDPMEITAGLDASLLQKHLCDLRNETRSSTPTSGADSPDDDIPSTDTESQHATK